MAPGQAWEGRTGDNECCLVLLRGSCRVEFGPTTRERLRLGHARSARGTSSTAIPHAIYLPPLTRFRVVADEVTELADGRARRRASAWRRA